MQTDIVHSGLEQANIIAQELMALLLVIGVIVLVLYVVGVTFGSLIKESLRG